MTDEQGNSQFVLDCERIQSIPYWVFGLRTEISIASHPVRVMYLVNAVTGEAKFMIDMWCTGIGGLLRGYDKHGLHQILGPFGVPLDSEVVAITYKILQDPSISLDPAVKIHILTGEVL